MASSASEVVLTANFQRAALLERRRAGLRGLLLLELIRNLVPDLELTPSPRIPRLF
jgi:hypothetical protein